MKSNGADILVVDDEADIRDLVAGLLEDEGHSIRTASNSDEALAAIRARKPSLAVLDIWMQGGGIDGLELLDIIRTIDPDLPVVMISGHGNIETAVSALQRGAYDFIEKPFKSDRLVVVIERALEAATLRLRAIAMTMISTVLAGLPLILSSGPGSEARAAIGWVVFGGLGLAAIFTLLLTPAIYVLVAWMSKPRGTAAAKLEAELAAAGIHAAE